jgi:molybdopterin adenylyltransferase
VRVAIVTVSDTVAAGRREDLSGPAVRQRCHSLGWQVDKMAVLPDEADALRKELERLADSGKFDLVLTTGGTGVGLRDVTPDVTAEICHKMLPGVGEHMRATGLRLTKRAILSRATAGVRAAALIVNLPGSPAGAVESFDSVAALLHHASEVLKGARHD